MAFDYSIVIPAYNEESRITPTLEATVQYLELRKLQYEIIVVNDGSSDRTVEVVSHLQSQNPHIKLVSLPQNCGKGEAVRCGMLQAKGQLVLFADADGATPIAELARLEAALQEGADVVIGSRALKSEETSVTTWLYRKLLGRIFNFLVNSMLLPSIADTQCGFKLFRANACKEIFQRQRLKGFSFDVEILYLARRLHYSIKEVPINWTNIAGSKVNVIIDGIRMMLDIFRIKVIHRHVVPVK